MITIKDKKQVGKMEMFTVVMPDGTEVADCKKMTGQKGDWISGPSRKFTTKEGTEKYFQLVKFNQKTQDEIIASIGSKDVKKPALTDDDDPF